MSRVIVNRGRPDMTGRQLVQSQALLNLNTCRLCGTHNPSESGEQTPRKCAGCGCPLRLAPLAAKGTPGDDF
jgi:hypothetical protein